MAFQSVPNTAEAVLRFTCNGVILTNTFYGLFPGAYTVTDLENLAAAMDGWAHSDWKGLVSNTASYLNVVVRGLTSENDFEVQNADNAGIGGIAAAPLPVNIAFCVKRQSTLTGRSARGRVYLTAMSSGQLSSDENIFSSTYITAAVAALQNVRGVMTTAGFTEVIVSRYANGVKRATGVTFPVVNYVNTSAVVDTRRDRLPV